MFARSLHIAALIGAVPALALPTNVAAQTSPQLDSLRADAKEFYLYTVPLLEVMRRRDLLLRTAPVNTFVHERNLADETSRDLTTPNNDTMYSNAFLDLREGPLTIRVPATGTKRYFSVALMDAWTNNFAYFGTRATGGKAVDVIVIGPDGVAPPGATHVVRAPTPWVWAFVRTLVTGPDDLLAAHAVQDGLAILGGKAGPRPPVTPPRDAPAAELHAAALRLIAENRPTTVDALELERFRAAGLDRPYDPSNGRGSAIEQGFAEGRDMVRTGRSVPGTGEWRYSSRIVGNFGTDYLHRAGTAVGGLAAITRDEAMYMTLAAPTPTGMYDGNRTYRMHFPKGGEPPVNAFWSLTMYERGENGASYLVANPIRRYSIGDRTPGLTRNADGSLDIWIGHRDPGPARRTNWLPAPAGPFRVSLRFYLPKPELADEHWQAPPLVEADY